MWNRRVIVNLDRRISALETALSTALVWMSQSANTPLRPEEVESILKNLERDSR